MKTLNLEKLPTTNISCLYVMRFRKQRLGETQKNGLFLLSEDSKFVVPFQTLVCLLITSRTFSALYMSLLPTQYPSFLA